MDSTNRYAADAARTGSGEGLVVVAEAQSAGRGRLGRAWVAPPSSALLCSLLLQPPLEIGALPLVTFALALAAGDAIAATTGLVVDLKWPNDLLVGERKLAGILAEVVAPLPGRAGRSLLVVGIGVNLSWPDDLDLPAEQLLLLEGATTLAAEASDPGRELLLWALLDAFAPRYELLGSSGGAAATIAAYRERCATLGKAVRVTEASGEWEGVAHSIDDSGRLVVERGTQQRVLDAADVVHLRRSEGR